MTLSLLLSLLLLSLLLLLLVVVVVVSSSLSSSSFNSLSAVAYNRTKKFLHNEEYTVCNDIFFDMKLERFSSLLSFCFLNNLYKFKFIRVDASNLFTLF